MKLTEKTGTQGWRNRMVQFRFYQIVNHYLYRIFLIILLIYNILCSCQKEKISIGANISDTFFLVNNGATMRIIVEGNTGSQTFLIFVHGGPGTGSTFYNTNYISKNIENKYAVVYWDQRNSGASQGSTNGKNLNLPQMTEDLKKVIQLLKGRYGQNSGIFVLGHSFGGLLVSSFMTTANYQSMVKGWICVDGSHNYPLNDTLTRQMLLTVGQEQIALNKNPENWTPIISYGNTHPGNFTLEESYKLSADAADAETYIAEVNKFDYVTYLLDHLFSKDLTLTAQLFNHLYSSNAAFNTELAKTEFSTSLYKVVRPTLILYGKYDFICPPTLGEDLFNRINTSEKRMVISPVSGHNLMFQDETLFCDEVNNFIEHYK